MENEITTWLNGPRDYATGRAIFEKYSRKTPLINLFRRKYKPEVLLYNLQKLSGTKIKPERTNEIQLVQEKTTSVENRKTIVTDRINYEDLPADLQKVYDQNKELYKNFRAYHEKMKLSATNEERAKLRKTIAEYDDKIAGNWKKIDSWDQSEEKITTEAGNTEKMIAAARKWLSINIRYLGIREGIKQQHLVFGIREKIALLKNNNVKIPKATIIELEKFGIHY